MERYLGEHTPKLGFGLMRLPKLGGGKMNIFLRREDMPLAEKISEACGAEAAEGGFTLGGLIAENPERHLRLDLSYDESLARAVQSFDTIVASERGV